MVKFCLKLVLKFSIDLDQKITNPSYLKASALFPRSKIPLPPAFEPKDDKISRTPASCCLLMTNVNKNTEIQKNEKFLEVRKEIDLLLKKLYQDGVRY